MNKLNNDTNQQFPLKLRQPNPFANTEVDKQKLREYFPWALLVALLSQGHLFVDLVPQDGVIKEDSERRLEDIRNGDKLKVLIQSTFEDSTVIRVACNSSLTSNELSFRIAQAITDRRRNQERIATQAAIRARQSREAKKPIPRTGRNRRQTTDVRSRGRTTGGMPPSSTGHGLGLGGILGTVSKEEYGLSDPSSGVTDLWGIGNISEKRKTNKLPGTIGSMSSSYQDRSVGSDFKPSRGPTQFGASGVSFPSGGAGGEAEGEASNPEAYVLLVESIEQAPLDTICMVEDLLRHRWFHVPISEGDTEPVVSYMKVMLPAQFVVIATSSSCSTPTTSTSIVSTEELHLPLKFMSEFLLRVPVDVSQLSDVTPSSAAHGRASQDNIRLRRIGRSVNSERDKGPLRVNWQEVKRMTQACQRLHISHEMKEYTRNMVSALRLHPLVQTGPKLNVASQTLQQALASCAVLRGRGYAVPTDLLSIALETLAHLIVLKSHETFARTSSKPSEPPACFLEPPKDWHPMVLARFIVHQVYEFYLPVIR